MSGPGGKRWTREEWERVLAEERRAEQDRPPTVAPGSRVELELIDRAGQAEPMRLVLVPDDLANLAGGFLGMNTPLARALLGQPAGSAVDYHRGDIVQVRILHVVPGEVPETDAAAERQAVIQRAIDRSELAETQRFALTFDSKWGDYDPEGIAPQEEEAT